MVVLQSDSTLEKADPVVGQVLAPVQLVGRTGLQEAVVHDVGTVQVGMGQSPVGGPGADPDHLAVHHVRLVRCRHRVHALQRLREELVVVVGKEDVVTVSARESDVARTPGPTGVGDGLDVHVRPTRSSGPEQVGRLVR